MTKHSNSSLFIPRSRGFTLLEIIVASAMFTVIVGGLISVLFSSMKLRENTFEKMESKLERDRVVRVVKEDMASIVPPVGVLAGAFLGEKEEERGVPLDSLEFYTASGILNDLDPWGDIVKVEYFLDSPEWEDSFGYDLVRAVTRNHLATEEEEPEMETLARDVKSLEFSYYDGEEWAEDWDSTAQDNQMPLALRMLVRFPQPGDRDFPGELAFENNRLGDLAPIEIVAAILAQAPPDLEPQEEGEDPAGGQPAGDGGANPGGGQPGGGAPGGGGPDGGGGR